MAVKKQETEAAVQAAPEKDTEVIRLFKDNQRYKTPVFVGVNGETYLIQRGVDVESGGSRKHIRVKSGLHGIAIGFVLRGKAGVEILRRFLAIEQADVPRQAHI